jgi:hypothetical protein
MHASLALGTADTLHEHGPSLSANVPRRSLAVMDTSTSIIVAGKGCNLIELYISEYRLHSAISILCT